MQCSVLCGRVPDCWHCCLTVPSPRIPSRRTERVAGPGRATAAETAGRSPTPKSRTVVEAGGGRCRRKTEAEAAGVPRRGLSSQN